jgi:hypothetical protein
VLVLGVFCFIFKKNLGHVLGVFRACSGRVPGVFRACSGRVPGVLFLLLFLKKTWAVFQACFWRGSKASSEKERNHCT